MSNSKLQEFVDNAAARGRITFGDVRRLRRDYLPTGISHCEEAEMLIRLDSSVEHTDRAWTDWLTTTIVDFAFCNSPPTEAGASATSAWLKALLAANGTSTKASRRIARDIQRDADRASPTTSVRAKITKKAAPRARAVVPEAVGNPENAIRLAAYVTFDCRNLAGSFARTVPQPFFGPIL
jgi:hypothetical protein